MKSQSGVGVLQIILIVAVLSLLIQLFMLQSMRNEAESARQMQLREMKLSLLNSLLETVRDEMTLRNSRLDVNDIIVKCLGGSPTCLESEFYDFIIFSPTPPYTFTGAWPSPPAGLKRMLGGETQNIQLYNIGGGRCDEDITELNNACPLQAFARIRPLCGGTNDAPALSVAGGGTCLTPATGFEIKIGVGSYWHGNLYYNEDTTMGDQRSFIVSSRTFLN